MSSTSERADFCSHISPGNVAVTIILWSSTQPRCTLQYITRVCCYYLASFELSTLAVSGQAFCGAGHYLPPRKGSHANRLSWIDPRYPPRHYHKQGMIVGHGLHTSHPFCVIFSVQSLAVLLLSFELHITFALRQPFLSDTSQQVLL